MQLFGKHISIHRIFCYSSHRCPIQASFVRIRQIGTCVILLASACLPGFPENTSSPHIQNTHTEPVPSQQTLSTQTPESERSPTIEILSKSTKTPSSSNSETTPNPASSNMLTQPTVTDTRMHLLTSDLVFLSQGKLMRWDHVTDYIGILAEGVVDFSVSANGKAIAMLRTRNITANGVEQYGLDLLDFDTKQITTILDQIPNLFHMVISPNAEWISFTYQKKPVQILALQADGATRLAAAGQLNPTPVVMGQCESDTETTSDMKWSPDSRTLLWSDLHGIWSSSPSNGNARLIQPNQVNITDPQQKTIEIEVIFHSLEWSPAGRFALVTVVPTSSNVNWQAVLDTRTGRLAQVPDSYEIDQWEANVSWMQNGDLLVLHASNPITQKSPFVKIYRLFPTNNNLLVSTKIIELQEDLLRDQSLPLSNSAFCLDWPKQLNTRTLILGSAVPGIPSTPSLFSIDLELGGLERMFELPQETGEILWSPDGQNALVLGLNGQVLFATLQGGALRDLRSLLNEDAHDFIWLPPVPRF